jgi:hypothetical protein
MKVNEYLAHLRLLRDDFSDEIPDKLLHSPMGQPKYKVRKSWFQGVIADARNIVLDNYAHENTKEQFQEFWDYYETSGMSSRLTTRKDIDKANQLLCSLIADLEAL